MDEQTQNDLVAAGKASLNVFFKLMEVANQNIEEIDRMYKLEHAKFKQRPLSVFDELETEKDNG